MTSNFKLFPNFNISQNFIQNVQKQKNTFVLSCSSLFLYRNLPIPPVRCWNTAGHSCMYFNIFAAGTAGYFPAGSAQDDEGNDIEAPTTTTTTTTTAPTTTTGRYIHTKKKTWCDLKCHRYPLQTLYRLVRHYSQLYIQPTNLISLQ